MKKYTAIDLFCGAGGLTCGLKQAGFDVLAGIEMQEIAAETYYKNHKNTLLLQDDICNISPNEVMRMLRLRPKELALLAGCPPCQGFSSLRTRNKNLSVDDQRNELIFEFIRWVKVFLPMCIMLENVPSLAKDSRMQIAVSQLRDLGYVIDNYSVRVEDIADYGIPQRRNRMILLASLYGTITPPDISIVKATVKEAIAGLPKAGMSGDPLHDYPEERSEKIKKLISLIPKNGGSRSDLPEEYWLECHKRYPSGFKDVYGRMRWDDVAPTITGGCHNPSKGRFLHPEEDRAITLREAALLQSFPQDYFFSLRRGKDSVALMIGNALPPKFIRLQGEAIMKHLDTVN
ncbi:MAG TPA: DNA cytosine methyltransferase [Nitrosomonas sp.]|nr:DNA cytosine methyltransferase [Nitrosomonas sp.]